MWISESAKWNTKGTALEKFLLERIIQRCDDEEVISNRHRTTSGYVQLKELIKLCELTYKRERTVRTLQTIINESKSKVVKQNILNDSIIGQYFQDLKEFIACYDSDNLTGKSGSINLTELKKFEHQLKVYELQIDSYYFDTLIKELAKIDYQSASEFQRNAMRISDLIDLLIPFLLFQGYSISSLREVLRKWVWMGYHVTAKRIISFFSLKENTFRFLVCFEKNNDEVADFLAQLKLKYSGTAAIDIGDLDYRFVHEKKIDNHEVIIGFTANTIDPHSLIRSTYDQLLKRIVIQKERSSLHPFNNYFDKCFWRFAKADFRYHDIDLDHDPVNVQSRKSTFRKTVQNFADSIGEVFLEDFAITYPKDEVLQKSIYYYNMALGSKSIENSLSLLWTAMEVLLPSVAGSNDINTAQILVSKSLSIGALSRDVNSFASRFIQSNAVNHNCLNDLGTRGFNKIFTTEGLSHWFDWLSESGDITHRFKTVNECSELLAYQYAHLGKNLSKGNLNFVLARIEASQQSMVFQLQRIYLHRNQIVHAGDLVNEYSNLWLHLEWYVGKLLAFCYSQKVILGKDLSVEIVFREMEADYSYLVSYLQRNKSKPIGDSKRIKHLLFKYPWQSY